MFHLNPESVAGLLLLIPGIPILGAVINGLFGKALGRDNVHVIAVGAVATSFVISVGVFLTLLQGEHEVVKAAWTWIHVGDLELPVRLLADRLSGILLLVITGIGTLIHVYSTGYMAHDEGYWRFFSYLNLFVGMMLILVLGDSLPLLFVGWEGVGLCSYLLIGFWYTDTEKAIAGKKAFIVNRIGDLGFIVGMFTLFTVFGTMNLSDINAAAGSIDPATSIGAASIFGGWTFGAVISLGMLALFVGCTGKSAQIPLFVWLPDAMAGPTPVSALIHAATMVTAGVYLLARLSEVLVLVPGVMAVIAFVGALTALVGAFMGLFQRGIKKVLAYSTVSQLGYMFLGVGVGAFSAGVFHLFTHAFFKACLFLGAGAVMHAMSDEEDIFQMGGLKKVIPHTHRTFQIATIAITGFFLPLSGFWSKDAILHQALVRDLGMGSGFGWTLWTMGSIGAFFTSTYMWRLYILTFEGEPRNQELHDHAHESPASMTGVLWALAVGSILALFFGLPHFFGHFFESISFDNWLGHVTASHTIPHAEGSLTSEIGFLVFAYLIAAGGFLTAKAIWGKRGPAGDTFVSGRLGPIYVASYRKLWWDEFYMAFIVKPLVALSRGLHAILDAIIIDRGMVDGLAATMRGLARFIRPIQNGDAQRYAAVIAIAGTLFLAWIVGYSTRPPTRANAGDPGEAVTRVVEVNR